MNNKKIALVIVTDDNYININYCIVTLNSFLYNNKWFDGDIIFFEDNYYNKISTPNKERLKCFYDKIKFINIGAFEKYRYIIDSTSNQMADIKYYHAWPKFEIFNLEEYDKVLCVDSDIIFCKDIKELFDKDYDFAGTSSLRYFYDDLPLIYENSVFELTNDKIADSCGFNSGVMYFGTKKFLNHEVYKKFYSFMNNYIKNNLEIDCFDQNILVNFFAENYKDNVVWLPPFYNVCIYKLKWDYEVNGRNIKNELDFLNNVNNEKINELVNNAIILHYLFKYHQIPEENKKLRSIYEKYLYMDNNISLNHSYHINLNNFKNALVIIGNDDINKIKICMKSFLFNNKWFNGDIVFFEDNEINIISDDYKKQIKEIYDNVKFYYVDYNRYKFMMDSDIFNSQYCNLNNVKKKYVKFEIFDLLQYDKILCVESNILFTQSIKELFYKDIAIGVTSSNTFCNKENNFYNFNDEEFKRINGEFIEDDSSGFNAGLIYLGNKTLRIQITIDIINFIKECIDNPFYKGKFYYFEQCILNNFFTNYYNGYVKFINPIYNFKIGDYSIYNKLTNKLSINKLKDISDNAKVYNYEIDPNTMNDNIFKLTYDFYNNLDDSCSNKYKEFKDIINIKYKTAVCVSCKNEHPYIREFVSHYKKLGFDHIYIINNDDDEIKHFMPEILKDYIDKDYVTIIDYNNEHPQIYMYTFVYKEYGNYYEWIAYFDCDELLEFTDGSKNINEFLTQKKFRDYTLINVFWETYGDDDQVRVIDNDYSMENRFKIPIITNTIEDYQSKSIIRTNLPIDLIEDAHVGNTDECVKRCNCNGEPITFINSGACRCEPITYKGAKLKHYRTKTIEEYCKFRYSKEYTWTSGPRTHNPHFFFMFNKRTPEKEQFIKDNYPFIYEQLQQPYNLSDYYGVVDSKLVFKQFKVNN